MASYKYGFQVDGLHNVRLFVEGQSGSEELYIAICKYQNDELPNGSVVSDNSTNPPQRVIYNLNRWVGLEIKRSGADWLISLNDQPDTALISYVVRIKVTPSIDGVTGEISGPEARISNELLDYGDLPKGAFRIIGMDDVRPIAASPKDVVIGAINSGLALRYAGGCLEIGSTSRDALTLIKKFDLNSRTAIKFPH